MMMVERSAFQPETSTIDQALMGPYPVRLQNLQDVAEIHSKRLASKNISNEALAKGFTKVSISKG